MQYKMQNVEFTCADKNLTPNEKLEAIQNELLEDSYYSEDGNIYGEGNLCNLDIEDWGEEQYNTNLPSEYLEEGVDAGLREFARLVHANAQCDVSQKELDEFDRLDNVMTINYNPRDKRKFFVMSERQDGNGIRKIIWNEEGNFEERFNPDDEPDWLTRSKQYEEKKEKEIKEKQVLKFLWNRVKELRKKYKEDYDMADYIKGIIPLLSSSRKEGRIILEQRKRKEGNEAYKEYKKYSGILDRLNELEIKEKNNNEKKMCEHLFDLFVQFKHKCPEEYKDCVSRDDIKVRYKRDGYEPTRYYIKRLIFRCEDLNARKKYDEGDKA